MDGMGWMDCMHEWMDCMHACMDCMHACMNGLSFYKERRGWGISKIFTTSVGTYRKHSSGIKLRSTEVAVRGHQYGQRPSSTLLWLY